MLEIIVGIAISIWVLEKVGVDLRNPDTRAAIVAAINNKE